MNDEATFADDAELDTNLQTAVQAIRCQVPSDEAIDGVKLHARRLSEPSPARTNLAPRILRYSSVAAAIALVGGVVWMGAVGNSHVAFAEVIDNARKAKSVTFNLKETAGTRTVRAIKCYVQSDRVRYELANGIVLVESIKDSKLLYLDMEKKQAAQLDAPTDTAVQSAARWIEQLQRVKPEDAESLGQRTREPRAEVFRVKQIKFLGREAEGDMEIWVDPQSQLPLRIELRDAQGTNIVTLERMRWNDPLDDDLFSLGIPAGFAEKPIETLRARIKPHPVAPQQRSKSYGFK